jgi:hypothetical protein
MPEKSSPEAVGQSEVNDAEGSHITTTDDQPINSARSGSGSEPAAKPVNPRSIAGETLEGTAVKRAAVVDANATVTAAAVTVTPSRETTLALYQYRTALLDLVQSSPPDGGNDKQSRNRTLDYEHLLARYVGLWGTLERPDCINLSPQALIGLKLLMSGRYSTASRIFRDIEFNTSAAVALSYVMRGVALFLAISSIIAMMMLYSIVLMPRFALHIMDIERNDPELGQFFVATIAGMLGGVVSLLLRLGEFETTRGRSQIFLVLTGATLPVVGGAFGAFIAALLCSKIINVGVAGTGQSSVWLFGVIGFLSGFSERFSRGFIQFAEQRLGGADKTSQVKISAQASASGSKSDVAPSAAS